MSGLSSQIGNMEYRIQDMLEEQSNPIKSFEWEVAGYFPEEGRVSISLYVELKRFDKGTQTQFILTQTSEDGTETKYEDSWRSGPDFLGDATLFLDQETTCVLRLKDADGVIETWEIEADFSQLRTEEFELGTFSLDTLVPIQVGHYATVMPEIPSILIHGVFCRPMSAELTVSVNGETRYLLPLTLEVVQENQDLWRGQSGEPVEELRLKEGDTVEFSITMEDDLGRKTVETSAYVATKDFLQLAAEERHTSVPWK